MNPAYRTFFLVAALYDLILGAVFFLGYGPMFELLGIALPNNISYIHLTASFVFVQGLGYWFVYQDPIANRGIAKIGVAYKFAFAALSFYYLAIGELLLELRHLRDFLPRESGPANCERTRNS
jgi:hypothetical protein